MIEAKNESSECVVMVFLFLISFYSEFLFILILQFLQGFMFFSNGLILIGFC